MNKEAIIELANFMEACHLKFHMSTSYAAYKEDRECGTAGCIAGHAAVLWPEIRTFGSATDESKKIRHYADFEMLQERFDLSNDAFTALISPLGDEHGVDYMSDQVDKPWAIRVLRHLSETGQVDWRITAPAANLHPDLEQEL